MDPLEMDGSQLAQYPDIKPDHRLMIVARYEMITTHKIQASDAAQDIHGLKVQLGSLLKEVSAFGRCVEAANALQLHAEEYGFAQSFSCKERLRDQKRMLQPGREPAEPVTLLARLVVDRGLLSEEARCEQLGAKISNIGHIAGTGMDVATVCSVLAALGDTETTALPDAIVADSAGNAIVTTSGSMSSATDTISGVGSGVYSVLTDRWQSRLNEYIQDALQSKAAMLLEADAMSSGAGMNSAGSGIVGVRKVFSSAGAITCTSVLPSFGRTTAATTTTTTANSNTNTNTDSTKHTVRYAANFTTRCIEVQRVYLNQNQLSNSLIAQFVCQAMRSCTLYASENTVFRTACANSETNFTTCTSTAATATDTTTTTCTIAHNYSYLFKNALWSTVSKIFLLYCVLLMSMKQCAALTTDVDLSTLAGPAGFAIRGGAASDWTGNSVSAAGDVNGDGIEDVIVGAYQADPIVSSTTRYDAGISYVLFGRSQVDSPAAYYASINLLSLKTAGSPLGFAIWGAAAGDSSGYSVSAAGDVNGDGLGDVIVGAFYADPVVNSTARTDAGISYVIFGRSKTVNLVASYANIDLLPLNTAGSALGFAILGAASTDFSGRAVSAAGDVNGDGISDVIVGAYQADPVVGTTRTDAGISYVIFGRSKANNPATYYATIDLLPLNTAGSLLGFAILGAVAVDKNGRAVSAAGDVNGDGLSDVIVGSFWANPVVGGVTRAYAGTSYVIFGRNKTTSLTASYTKIDLLPLNTAGSALGFAIFGAAAGYHSGYSVSAAGDVNGDGIGDVIVGASDASPVVNSVTRTTAGVSYVIFGRRKSANEADSYVNIDLLPLSTAESSLGFAIFGAAAGDMSGYSVSAAGDVNGDGIVDMILGAYGADPVVGGVARNNAGTSYVIFGRRSTVYANIDLTTFTNAGTGFGFRIFGGAVSDGCGASVSRAGDVNKDGVDDILVGASNGNGGTGASYVIFGALSAPTSQPSSQPSAQPSRLPSTQPSSQPSAQPVLLPTAQPSRQPSEQPSSRPSGQPTGQPSVQPVLVPTAQPSRQPTAQPSSQPSGQPSSRPTCQPSAQLSMQPTNNPSSVPSSQPSTQPSTAPSAQPSADPTQQPSARPSGLPTSPPSSQPSGVPSVQPTSMPSTQPSGQPSNRPSMQPTVEPSAQPSLRPNVSPSGYPTAQPSSLPSVQPSAHPSLQPSAQPSTHPSSAPSEEPTAQPSASPTSMPSVQHTTQPSSAPSSQPSVLPSSRPSSQPTPAPSSAPSAQLSGLPSMQPTSQPTAQPSATPSTVPSAVPTVHVLQNEWAIPVAAVTRTASLKDQIWSFGGQICLVVEATSNVVAQYTLPWGETVSMLSVGTSDGVILHGQTRTTVPKTSAIAHCAVIERQLSCGVKSIPDAVFHAGARVPLAAKVVYVGAYNVRTAILIVDAATTSMVLNTYSAANMKSLALTHVASPPHFIGAFVAGTSARATGTGAVGIVLGMVRTDQGVLNAMSVYPVSGAIVNNADLVTGSTLENTLPDSFIVGGLQVTEGISGKHAYLLRANGLFKSVKYCVRYRVNTEGGGRRALSSAGNVNSVARGVALVGTELYTVLDVRSASTNISTMTVLKVLIDNGDVAQQVHIIAPNSSLSCTDLTSTGPSLIFACHTVSGLGSAQYVLLSTGMDLAFSSLPSGWTRANDDRFSAEAVPFQRTVLTVTKQTASFAVSESMYNSGEQSPSRKPSTAPTMRPSSQPSSAPSAQPSSSPTATPTVSVRPTSQPSSAVPTNTHKPTAAPTVAPSVAPSAASSLKPTARPSLRPSLRPVAVPTTHPTPHPMVRPSAVPTALPTKTPSLKPTAAPKCAPSQRPTRAPTSIGSVEVSESRNRSASPLVLSSVFGTLGFVVLCFVLYKYRVHVLENYKKDQRRVVYFREQEALVRANELEREKLMMEELVKLRERGEKKAVQAQRAATEPSHDGAYAVSPRGQGHDESDSSSSVVLSSLHSSEASFVQFYAEDDASYNVSGRGGDGDRDDESDSSETYSESSADSDGSGESGTDDGGSGDCDNGGRAS